MSLDIESQIWSAYLGLDWALPLMVGVASWALIPSGIMDKVYILTLLRETSGRMTVRSPGEVPGHGAQGCRWKLKKSRRAAAVSTGKGWKCVQLPKGHGRWERRAILWSHQGPSSGLRGFDGSKKLVTFGWDHLGSSPHQQDKRTLS